MLWEVKGEKLIDVYFHFLSEDDKAHFMTCFDQMSQDQIGIYPMRNQDGSIRMIANYLLEFVAKVVGGGIFKRRNVILLKKIVFRDDALDVSPENEDG